MNADRYRPYTEENEGPPDFLVTLGLAPPVTEEEVDMAYREKARAAQPDQGGDPGLKELQSAYERAKEYTRFRASRRGWLANQVDRYVAQQEIVEQLEGRGVQVQMEEHHWLDRSFGEGFASLAEKIEGLVLSGPEFGDDDLEFLAAHAAQLKDVRKLDLSHSKISDQGLMLLAKLRNLTSLDVSHTAAASHVVDLVHELPELRKLDITGAHVGMWKQLRLRFSDLEIVR